MKRRDFMKGSLGGILAAVATNRDAKGRETSIPKRNYNKEIRLSIIGFGGIVVLGMEQAGADQLVSLSIDRGVNYFDIAPSYGDGEAEVKLGKALTGHRHNIFLACKTMERDRSGAKKELDRSLKRLKTDYFDLYQLHAVTTLEEVKKIFAPSGAMETFVDARQKGKIRHIGFSAHSEEAALALLEGYGFDSILFPVNFVCYSQGKFGPRVIQKAQEKGAARLALKMLAYSPWPEGSERTCSKCWYRPVEEPDLAEKALRFTLSEPVTAAIPPGDERLFMLALDLAAHFQPLSPAERSDLFTSAAHITPLFRA